MRKFVLFISLLMLIPLTLNSQFREPTRRENAISFKETHILKSPKGILEAGEGYQGAVAEASFSPDGKILASGYGILNGEDTIILWNPHTGKRIRTLVGHTGSVNTVCFSPDGQMLASASQNLNRRTFIQLWDSHTGEFIREFAEVKGRRFFSNCFSPDGQMLASAAFDKTIRLWNPYTGKIIRTLAGHDSDAEISSLNFSPDGKMLASTSKGKTVKLWNPYTGKLIRTLTENEGRVSAATFSPDGQILASVNYNNTVKLWNPHTGKLITTLTGKGKELSSVIFSPDGDMLAAWSVYWATTTLWSTGNLKVTETPKQQEVEQSGSKPRNDNAAGIVLYPPGQEEIEQSGSKPRTDNTTGIVLDPSGQQEVEENTDKPNNIDGMVLIPAGEFQMGNNDFHDNEGPVHTVYIDAFYIDQYEVTNAQYKAFVDANPEWQKMNINERFHSGTYLYFWDEENNYPDWAADHPVTYVSWYAAMAYAEWTDKRLPTEAEWEKAARGDLTGKAYPWGDSIDAGKANCDLNFGGTLPVGTYAANAYELYDIIGNVWEWCLDAYDPGFYRNSRRQNPVADTDRDSIADIISKMENTKTPRIFRGGSWSTQPVDVRVSLRAGGPPECAIRGVGFRCVSEASTDNKKREKIPPLPR